ncbi:MAG: hypothetical protein ACI9UK_001683 [Candidatus Krumholzibacteriia bacterium]|jgi:hypothetical protein
MNETDRLIQMRIRAMVYAAIAFGIWQLSWLATDILEPQGGTRLKIAQITTTLGALAWVAASFFYARFNSQVKKASACGPLNDELTCHNRAQSFGLGYAITMIGIMLLIAAASIIEGYTIYGLKLIAITGVIVPILTFARLEHNNDLGAE